MRLKIMSYKNIKTNKILSDNQIDDLFYDNYGEYLMNNHKELPIGNGHMLLEAMEKGLFWTEFLASMDIVEV
jgi:hypothetical protein